MTREDVTVAVTRAGTGIPDLTGGSSVVTVSTTEMHGLRSRIYSEDNFLRSSIIEFVVASSKTGAPIGMRVTLSPFGLTPRR